MKKRLILFIGLLAMIFSISAQAITPRANKLAPSFSINSSGLATCAIAIRAETSNDDIYVEAELLQDGDPYRSWTGSGTGRLNFSRVATVTKGHTYTFTADITIDGVEYSIRPISEDY